MNDSPTPARSSRAPLVAEALGTFILVLAVISTALFAAGFGEGTESANKGVGFIGVSFAVGLALAAGIYAFGPVSGGHFNPAVTVGLAAAGRFPWRGVLGYVIAQVIGGAVATTLIVLIGLFGPTGWLSTVQDGGFASNGFGSRSPGGFEMGAAILVEALFTAVFVLVILGVTHAQRGSRAVAGLIIGLTLAVIHLATIPIDNTSINPARSIATAIYGGFDALAQLWVFLVFPILGALIAGYAYRAMFGGAEEE
ncbi:aquaporin Z [Microbacterium aoyamense]|uniref:Aquaporin Z n=1 Tax=Microbacterium aoyamense TaxID=344166 RepID=A0ABP5B1F8_9MICO|nr:aquaporin [Microbacterium aoyamense]